MLSDNMLRLDIIPQDSVSLLEHGITVPRYHPRPCRNCGLCHLAVPGMYSTDCVVIGGKCYTERCGRISQISPAPAHDLTTYPIPVTIREQADLFDRIWFWFVDLKHENEDLRRDVAAHRRKGFLKNNAPLLWLQWKRWDGMSGQTRNQENFERLWKSFVVAEVDDCQTLPVAWITLKAMYLNENDLCSS